MGLKRPFEGYSEADDDLKNNKDIPSDDNMSSDDSIDMEPGPSHPPPAKIPSHKYGIGAELMAKMGYTSGSGLGMDGSGILDPIEVEKRQKRAGLGVEAPAPPPAPSKVPNFTNMNEAFENSNFAKLHVVKDELDLIRKQQNVLMHALHIIDSEHQNLDLLRFYDLFGSEPIWHSERLYEVVSAVLGSRIPQVNAFDWLMDHPDVLLAGNKALPENEWGKLLAEKWLGGPLDNLPQLIHQWVIGRSNGFAAVGNYLSQMFGDSEIARQAVTLGHDFLVQLMNVLPNTGYLTSEIRHSILSYSLEMQITVLSTIPTETATIAKIVLASPDLTTQAKTMTAFSKVLTSELLSDVLEKTHMRELWFEQLSNCLLHENPHALVETKLWYQQWRAFFSLFTESVVEPWLKAGLDVINSFLDGVRQPLEKYTLAPRQSQAQTTVISTLKDVLDHICFMNDFKLIPTTTGYIVKGAERELKLILENDVILIRQSQSLIPISLDVLQSYLLKS